MSRPVTHHAHDAIPVRPSPSSVGDAMTPPIPPSDADRIIAAHREESRRTRALLLWIFVGIPLVAGLIWGLVLIATQPPAVRVQSTYTGVDAPTTTTLDPCAGHGGEPAYAWCAQH